MLKQAVGRPCRQGVAQMGVKPMTCTARSLRSGIPERRCSHVVAFKAGDAQDAVRLPLHSQELLGIQAGERMQDSELNALYERLVESPVESGYSQLTLQSRLEVLDLVRREIIGSKGRTRDSHESTLSSELLPGAIALMTEVGHGRLAISMGTELLNSGEADAQPELKRDLHLTLALANCGLASECLEQNHQVTSGCGYLEAALRHLYAAGEPPVAPVLAGEIQQGLATLRIQGALEQLSGPVNPTKPDTRKRALRVVREAIKQHTDAAAAGAQAGVQQGSGRGPVTSDAMEKLTGVLTCEELVHLVEWEQVARNPAPHAGWLYDGLLEVVVVAHVVHGFVARQPAYIKMALALLKHLRESPDLSVVEGVCHMLLGAVNQAADALKDAERRGKAAARSSRDQGEHAGALPASRDAYRFVVSHSAGGDDGLLPGLCVLTERWLTQAAMPFFRDTAASPPHASLARYFDDTRVETLLTVYDEKSSSHLGSTLTAAYEQIKRGIKRAAAAGSLSADPDAGSAGSTPLGITKQHALLAVAGGAVLVAAVLGAGRLSQGGRTPVRESAAAAEAVVVQQQLSPGQVVTTPTWQLDVQTAHRLLKQWQATKASALGSGYRAQHLETVLAEPLLTETMDKVSTLRSHGCHMRYKLARMQVVEIQQSQPAGPKALPTARIVANMDETAALHGADGKLVSTARHQYNVVYTAVQGKDGGWRVTTTSVVDPAAQ